MTTTVYFVRHAQPDYGEPTDAIRPLTEKGKADSLLVTGYLRDKNVTAVLSSPYRRAVDTVLDFAERHALTVECDDGFAERKIADAWIKNFDDYARAQWNDFDCKLENGESLREARTRNLAALSRAVGRYRGGCLAVGSHGTALCTVINYFCAAFGYNDFNRIKTLTPWIVRMDFDDDACVRIETVDILNGGACAVLPAAGTLPGVLPAPKNGA